MLGKLIKYDLTAALRSLGPLYLALLGMSVVMGIFFRINFQNDTVMTFLAIVYGITFVICWVIPIVILTLRFRKNLLEDEGYLSFSLPVSTMEHIVAKVISALISTTVCALIVVVSLLIIGALGASFGDLREAFKELGILFSEYLDLDLVRQLLKAAILSVLASVEIITQIYAALAIGHLVKDHETLASVGAFIGMSLILSFVTNFLHLPNILQSGGMYYLYSVCLIAVFTSITWYILDRNLNLN